SAPAQPAKKKKAKKTKKDEEDLPLAKRFPSSFRCAGRAGGYYADVETGCRTYHVCNPTIDENGRAVVDRYTFLCEGENIFNQDSLTCASVDESLPCEFAPELYDINVIHGSRDF
ncbi:chitin binding domain-containing protein, partial [Klebsiella pneumoniae]